MQTTQERKARERLVDLVCRTNFGPPKNSFKPIPVTLKRNGFSVKAEIKDRYKIRGVSWMDVKARGLYFVIREKDFQIISRRKLPRPRGPYRSRVDAIVDRYL